MCINCTSAPAPTPAVAWGGAPPRARHWRVFAAGLQPVALVRLTSTQVEAQRAKLGHARRRWFDAVCHVPIRCTSHSSSPPAPRCPMVVGEGLSLWPQPGAGSYVRRQHKWPPRGAVRWLLRVAAAAARVRPSEGRESAGGHVFMNHCFHTDQQTAAAWQRQATAPAAEAHCSSRLHTGPSSRGCARRP